MEEKIIDTAYVEGSATANAVDTKLNLTSDEVTNLKTFLQYHYVDIPNMHTRVCDLEFENRKLKEEIQSLKDELYSLKIDISYKIHDSDDLVRSYLNNMSKEYVSSYCNG